jgi:CheY-like chemotaxis protein
VARMVLVADDSPTIQKRAQGILKGEGFEVETVSNGVAAIKKLAQIQPAVVLVDVSMPGRDGYEVCDFVKSSEEFRHVPVLLVASDMEPYDAERGARVRADGKIRKPFEPQELISVVAKLAAWAESVAVPSSPSEAPAPEPSPAPGPSNPEFSTTEEVATMDWPRADRGLAQISEGIAFAAPVEEAYVVPLAAPPPFQPETLLEKPAAETLADSETSEAFEPWVAGTPPAVPEPSVVPEPAEESESVEIPDTWPGAEPAEATTVASSPVPVGEARWAPEPETASGQVAESEAVIETGVEKIASEVSAAREEAPGSGFEAAEPVEEAAAIGGEPVLIEDPEAAPAEPGHIPTPEPAMIFRAPAQIAEPVLQDELAPQPPGQGQAPAAMGPNSATEGAGSLDSFSQPDAAAGQIRFGTNELGVAPPDESVPVEAPTVAPKPDWGFVYSIVYKVVARTASPDSPAETIEEMARNLTNEVFAELIAAWSQTQE